MKHKHRKTTKTKQKIVIQKKWLIISCSILILLGIVFITDQKFFQTPPPYSQLQVPNPQCLGSCINEEFFKNTVTLATDPEPQEKTTFFAWVRNILNQLLQLFGIVPKGPTPIPQKQEQAFCPRDIRQCSDGSYVKRIPPYCEFESCPTRNIQKSFCTREVKQCDDGSYVERKLPTCEFAACP